MIEPNNGLYKMFSACNILVTLRDFYHVMNEMPWHGDIAKYVSMCPRTYVSINNIISDTW